MYAASKDGQIIHIIKQVQNAGNTNHNGYMAFTIRKYGDKNSKTYRVHRFVWECLNGVIPDGKVIEHFNEDKEDNRLYNLQIVTQRANCKKSARKRDYTFAANNFQNRRCVKAINQTTQGVVYFNSMYAVQQRLSINTVLLRWSVKGSIIVKLAFLRKMLININLSIYRRKICLMIIKNQPISAQEAWLIRIIYRFSHR